MLLYRCCIGCDRSRVYGLAGRFRNACKSNRVIYLYYVLIINRDGERKIHIFVRHARKYNNNIINTILYYSFVFYGTRKKTIIYLWVHRNRISLGI